MARNAFHESGNGTPRVGDRWISWDLRDRGVIVKVGGSSSHDWLYDDTDTFTLAAYRGVPVLLDPTVVDEIEHACISMYSPGVCDYCGAPINPTLF